jgi:hypothetical protein
MKTPPHCCGGVGSLSSQLRGIVLEAADVGDAVGVCFAHVVVVTRPVSADTVLVGQVEFTADAVGETVFIAARRGFDAGDADAAEDVEGRGDRQLADDKGSEFAVEFETVVIRDAE